MTTRTYQVHLIATRYDYAVVEVDAENEEEAAELAERRVEADTTIDWRPGDYEDIEIESIQVRDGVRVAAPPHNPKAN